LNLKLFIALFLTIICLDIQAQKGDKITFFKAFEVNNIKEVNVQLKIVEKDFPDEKEGFEGALLMKKAGLSSSLKDKLSFFKAGEKKLEAALQKDSNNTEYHFLRLLIQENAPAILGYNDEIEKDVNFIYKNFKHLTPMIQKIVVDYSNSKKSKALNPAKLRSN
jgi:hypothetical protein